MSRALWKEEPSCSETGLAQLALELARELETGHRILLEGPMGAGKTTFARALLHALGVIQPPEGSPTFAIAHEYRSAKGEVVHMDLYRVKSDAELDDAGIPEYFWGREMIAITEWTSQFPEFERQIAGSGPSWFVTLEFAGDDRRKIRVERAS